MTNPSKNPVVEDKMVKTTLHLFYHWEKNRPQAVYLSQPWEGKYHDYTWRETGNQARRMASALRAMGLPPQSNIALFSKNCAHWVIADLAIKMAGHVSVPFYPNLTGEQLRQVMDHSESQVIFIGKLDNLDAVPEGVPEGVRRIALPLAPENEFEKWEDIISRFEPQEEDFLPDPDDIETIVYTSGTTGIPKGVVKTFYGQSAGVDPVIALTGFDKIEGRYLSYLPLNHDAERLVVESGSLVNGGTIYFVESIDTFADNLRTAKPTIFLAVPRIWSKFQQGVLEKIPPKRLDTLLKIPIVSGIIKKRILEGLGLDQCQFAISGAAPISPHVLNWFKRLGLTIHEGYGMTENSAVCTVNPPGDVRIGTVGKPYPGCNIKIDEETSEVLVKAPWIMKGYYKDPELSAEVLKDGWLHTGDMGEFTPEGYLKITGRVKDMFKTSKGEYVLPVPMERMFASNTLIEQVCVVGYGLPQPFALINLSDRARHMEEAEVEESLTETMTAVNDSVADYERIRMIVVTDDVWTVENGLLTPTLKVRRNIMDARYKLRMEQWYEEGGDQMVIWE